MSVTTEELKKLLDEATPGKWFAADVRGGMWGVYDALGRTVFPVYRHSQRRRNNARLAALAPDLAKRVIASEKLVEVLRFAHGWRDAQDMSHVDFRLEVGKRAEAAISEWETGE